MKKTKENKTDFGIVPLSDRVVLRPLKKEELEKKSASGIIIPDTVSNKEKPEQAQVVAVGPGKYDDGAIIPMTLKVGDRVIFSKYGFEELKHEGEEYYIISESQILAIIK